MKIILNVALLENNEHLSSEICIQSLEKRFNVASFNCSTKPETIGLFAPDIIIFDHNSEVNGIQCFRDLKKEVVSFVPIFRILSTDNKDTVEQIVGADIPEEAIKSKYMNDDEFTKFVWEYYQRRTSGD